MVCYRSAIKLEGGNRVMRVTQYFVAAAVAIGLAASPSAAQLGSEAERFVAAVRDRDASAAMGAIRSRPSIVDAKDNLGETGLLIAIARRDDDWLLFLLANGADPNAPARNNDRPLIAAARIGYATAVSQLLARKAKVDAGNKMGETALIVAVQQRHLPIVRMLLAAGADPDKADSAAGYSARDYAKRDARSREILKLIKARKPKA